MREKMKHKEWTINAHASSSVDSKKLGKLILIYEHRQGGEEPLKLYFEPADKKERILQIPDQSSSDHEYFDFTASEDKGDWVRLPIRGYEKQVWINPTKEWGKRSYLIAVKSYDLYYLKEPLNADGIQIAKGKIIKIIEIKDGYVKFRMTVDGDLDCLDDPPSDEGKKFFRIKEDALINKEGRLIIDGAIRTC